MTSSQQFDTLISEVRASINEVLQTTFKCRKLVGVNDSYMRKLDEHLAAALYAVSQAEEFSSPHKRPMMECRALRSNVLSFKQTPHTTGDAR